VGAVGAVAVVQPHILARRDTILPGSAETMRFAAEKHRG